MKKLFQTLTFAVLLINLLESCQQKKEKVALEYFKERIFTFLEPPKIEEHYFTDSLESYWRADTLELFASEQIIITALNELETENFSLSKETLPNFMRQYVCFINKQGEKMIWVNAHCHLEKRPPYIELGEIEFQPIDWRNNLVFVDDGEDCHWNILINIGKRTYSNFFINGV